MIANNLLEYYFKYNTENELNKFPFDIIDSELIYDMESGYENGHYFVHFIIYKNRLKKIKNSKILELLQSTDNQ